MPRRLRARRVRAALLAALAAAGAADARAAEEAEQAAAAAAPAPPPAPGRLLGPRYRYGALPVYRRVLYDVVAIPANADRWGPGVWLGVGLVGGSVTALMLPPERSLDVRIDRWLRRDVNQHLPLVWNDVMQPVLWTSIAAGGLGTWWWATATDHHHVAQGMSLMAEGLTVTQVYHLTFKILIGREGPTDGSREGRVLGPGRGLRYYPAGTPSGHAATLFSLLSGACAYFRPPLWLELGGHAAASALVLFHVIDHRHYLSEVIWGSAMGWGVARWVVEERRARPADGERRSGPRAALVPLLLPGGAGLALGAAL